MFATDEHSPSLQSAFEKGREAQRKGLEIWANPYDSYQHLRGWRKGFANAWIRGWLASKEEDEDFNNRTVNGREEYFDERPD